MAGVNNQWNDTPMDAVKQVICVYRPDAECYATGTCTCKNGFSSDGFACSDINECDANPCDPNASCTNSVGSFTCTCNNGYYGDGSSCESK